MSSLKKPEACESLTDIRSGIDFFDRQILESLQQRLGYVKAAVRFKANEQAIPAPERGAARRQDRRDGAVDAGFDVDFVEKLYEHIIYWNIQQQISHWQALHSERSTEKTR